MLGARYDDICQSGLDFLQAYQARFSSFHVPHEQVVLEPFNEGWSVQSEAPSDGVLFHELRLKLAYVYAGRGVVLFYLAPNGGR